MGHSQVKAELLPHCPAEQREKSHFSSADPTCCSTQNTPGSAESLSFLSPAQFKYNFGSNPAQFLWFLTLRCSSPFQGASGAQLCRAWTAGAGGALPVTLRSQIQLAQERPHGCSGAVPPPGGRWQSLGCSVGRIKLKWDC